MLAVIKRCGEKAEIKEIAGTLGDLQSLVGGLIEPVWLDEGTDIICNEEGKLMGLAPNVAVAAETPDGETRVYDIICGDMVLLGTDRRRGVFRGLTAEKAESLAAGLGERFLVTAGFDVIPMIKVE